jgi:hypothetical protein
MLTLDAFMAPPLTLLRMRTNRTQGTWCIHPDGPASCYRTPSTLLGSSCWEPSWVTIPGRGRSAPSGGWLRAGRASKGPPKEVPSPWPYPAESGSRWRVQGRGSRRGGNMSGVSSPDLPGPTAPRSRGGGIACRRSGPTTRMSTTTVRSGPVSPRGGAPVLSEEGERGEVR